MDKALRYTDIQLALREVPDEISLAASISGCPHRCPGCHSPWLQGPTGQELTLEACLEEIDRSPWATCFLLMGGDQSWEAIESLAKGIKETRPGIKIGWYSGGWPIEIQEDGTFIYNVDPGAFDYIKCGPYMASRGALDCPLTNQRMYKIEALDNPEEGWIKLTDITSRFWTHQP